MKGFAAGWRHFWAYLDADFMAFLGFMAAWSVCLITGSVIKSLLDWWLS
jgi:hypothetical protein